MNGRHRNLAYLALIALASITLFARPVSAVSVKEEIQIGKEAAAEVEKEYPVTDNKQWLEEIDRLGRSLLPYVQRKDIPYSFKIIKETVDGEEQIDAFSLPGGPVYLSERMWKMLTPDERLGVLAHEVSHVDKRDAINTIGEMNRRGLWAAALLLLTGADSSWWSASDLANQIYTLKYSRKREQEADLMAVDLCRASRQNPGGIVTAMEKLLRMEQTNDEKPLRILASHPDTGNRVVYLRQKCVALGLKPYDLELHYKELPDRVGDVISTTKDGMLVTVTTIQPLAVNDVVWIRKAVWDDKADAVICKAVARGVAITGGTKAQVAVNMQKNYSFGDIESGDGVYRWQPEPAPPPPPPGTK